MKSLRSLKSVRMFVFLSTLLVSGIAWANNTSGVFSPVVDPNDKSMMLRTSFVPGQDGDSDSFAYRLHYQQAFNEVYRWRIIGQFRDTGAGHEYDYLRAELLWYLTPNSSNNWDSGLRFDIRTRKGSRPEKFAINWTNQWQLTDKWQARGLFILGWDFGGNATGGTKLETRAGLSYKLESGQKAGLEMFSSYGKISDMGSWDEQEHQLGPVISGKWSDWKYQFGYLAGISDAANDHDFRVWFSTSF